MTDNCTDCPDDFAAVTADDETQTDEGTDPRGTKVTKWGPTLLAPIGKPTGDKRRFASGSLTNRDLPVALKWQRSDGSGHSGSTVVGTVDGIVYDDDGAPHGFGLLFSPDPEQLPRLAEDANEARLLLEKGALGLSVDLDDMEFHTVGDESQYAAGERPEIEVTRGRISAVTLVPIPAFAESGGLIPLTDMEPEQYQMELDAHRDALTASVRSSGWSGMPLADPGTAWDGAAAAGRIKSWAGNDMSKYARGFLWVDGDNAQNLGSYKFPIADVIDGDLKIVPKAVAAANAVLAGGRGGTTIPEQDQARMRSVLATIRKRFDRDSDGDDDRSKATDTDKDYASTVMEAMVAAATLNETAAGPLPAEWFEDPKLAGPTPITVTPDGRVFGHLATWGTCHTGIPNACTTPPKSRAKYAYFHTGAVDTTAGEMAVGRVSMGGGHADTRWGFQAAAEHYDSTSTQAAVVRAGEDKFGIWVAGSALPGADLDELKRSPLSGDWRRIGGNLELVHALAVNSPGFPVPRASMVAGAQMALVAAGVVPLDQPGGWPGNGFTADQMQQLVIQAVQEARRVEANYARAMAALGAMDEAGERGEKADRRRRAMKAVRKVKGGSMNKAAAGVSAGQGY